MQRQLPQILTLLLKHVVLLGAENGAGPCYPNPPNEGGRGEFEVLHGVAANQSSRAAQASLAVNSQHARISFGNLEEFANDGVGRRRSVNEEQVGVIDAGPRKFSLIVLGFVQTHHMGHAKVTKHLQIVFRRVASTLRSNLIHRAHKCDEFARQNPV